MYGDQKVFTLIRKTLTTYCKEINPHLIVRHAINKVYLALISSRKIKEPFYYSFWKFFKVFKSMMQISDVHRTVMFFYLGLYVECNSLCCRPDYTNMSHLTITVDGASSKEENRTKL